MREQVSTVTLTTSLHETQRLMTRRNVSAVPVVDEENPRKVLALPQRNVIGRAYSDELKRMKEGG